MYYSFYVNEQLAVDNWEYYKDANWLFRDMLERDKTRTAEEKAEYYLRARNVRPENDWLREYWKSEEFFELEWEYEMIMMDIEMEREYSEDHMYYGRVPRMPGMMRWYERVQGAENKRNLSNRFAYQAEKNERRGRKLRQINEVKIYQSDIDFIDNAKRSKQYTLKQLKVLFGAIFFSRMHDVKWCRMGTSWKKRQFDACFNGFMDHKTDFRAVSELFEDYSDWKPNTTLMHDSTKRYWNIGEMEFDYVYPNFDNKDEVVYVFRTTLENNRLNIDSIAEEVIPDLREKYCEICGERFEPNSNRQKYCKECKKEIDRRAATERKRRQRARERAKKCQSEKEILENLCSKNTENTEVLEGVTLLTDK